MIECVNVTKKYSTGANEFLALKNVSIKINDGEFVAIIGPSGSGKSTLMNILGALDKPSSGAYLLDGKDVSTMSDDELSELRNKKIGFVFQSFNLLPRATVIRNVEIPLVYADITPAERTKRAHAALAAAGLDESHFKHLSNELSGGQMQRVAIARALVNNPSLILADEPTGNLDSKTGEIALATFEELNKKSGHTVILITHEHDVAAHADRIIQIRDGMILSDSTDHKVIKTKIKI
jgi:putative ABC transport system ATP-binding protein